MNYDEKGFQGRQEKSVQPQNKFFPQGKFEDYTEYGGKYQENPIQRSEKFKPEGELKVNGGVFNANSSYENDYIRREGEARQKQIGYAANDVLPKGNFAGSSTYEDAYFAKKSERREKYKP